MTQTKATADALLKDKYVKQRIPKTDDYKFVKRAIKKRLKNGK